MTELCSEECNIDQLSADLVEKLDNACEALGLDRNLWRYNHASRACLQEANQLRVKLEAEPVEMHRSYAMGEGEGEGYGDEDFGEGEGEGEGEGSGLGPAVDYMGNRTQKKQVLEFKIPENVLFIKNIIVKGSFGYQTGNSHINIVLKQKYDTRPLKFLPIMSNNYGYYNRGPKKDINVELKINADSIKENLLNDENDDDDNPLSKYAIDYCDLLSHAKGGDTVLFFFENDSTYQSDDLVLNCLKVDLDLEYAKGSDLTVE